MTSTKMAATARRLSDRDVEELIVLLQNEADLNIDTVETTDATAITATQQSSSTSAIVRKAYNDVICSRDQ